MPKNVSCNSFYMFMLETKKRLESRGERFPRGMEDVVNVAAELWENMTPEQKNVYKEKAKDYKKSDEFSAHKKELRGRLPKKMREDGAGPSRRRAQAPVEEEEFMEPVPYLFPSDDEEAGEEFKKKHVTDRKEILDSWKWNLVDNKDGIMDLKCFVISFIYHARTAAYAYWPAEIALVEFSLREGVTNTYSRILGPHNLPAHLLQDAMAKSENGHKIPVADPTPEMISDYVRVMEEVLRFCRPSKSLRRLYCISKEFNCVQGCIKFLQSQAKTGEIRPDRVNCVDDLYVLFCEWRDKVCVPSEWRTFNDCDGLVPTAPFYQHPDLPCEFHKQRGVHQCALATAKRAAYYLLQRMQLYYRFPLMEKHRLAPMPPGALPMPPAAAWQMTLAAVQQAQAYHGMNALDEDASSVATGTTATTRRTTATDKPAPADMAMPKNLPMQLRRLAGHAAVPESWHETQANVATEEGRERQDGHGSRLYRGPTPSVAASTVSAAYNEPPMDSAGVNWDQNKDLRDMVYRNQNPRGKKPRGGAASVGRTAGQSEQQRDNAHEMESQENGVHNVQSYANVAHGVRPRVPNPSLRFPIANEAGIAPGLVNNLPQDFSGLRCAPPPVAFPTPQTFDQNLQQNNFAPRQRNHGAPRISMPPNLTGNINAGGFSARPTFNRVPAPTPNVVPPAQPGPVMASYQQGPPVSVPGIASGPPIRTQSRVKQLVQERMRQQQPSGE